MEADPKRVLQSGNSFLSVIQLASQFLLFVAGVVYLFGFVILCIFESTYGIAGFSVFRAKVIAVGSAFLFMLLVPTIAVYRLFHVHGLGHEPKLIVFTPKADLTRKQLGIHIIDVNLSIPFVCASFLFFVNPLLGLESKFSPLGNYLIAAIYAILVINGIMSKYYFHKVGPLIVIVSLTNACALFSVYYFCGSRYIFWLLLWMSSVAFIALHTTKALQEGKEYKKIEWERSFLIVVPLIFWIWATEIYPHIRHEIGGGSPIPVVFQLSKESLGVTSGTVVSLIDETDQGFYILSSSKKAFLIPRNFVESVQFVANDSSTESRAGTMPFHCERPMP
jgi:hypothetical protein